jgi:hypothetical protein
MPKHTEDLPPEEPTPTEPTPEEDFYKQEEATAMAQSPGEPQVVPEQRPQAFISATGGDSEAGKRAAARIGKAMGPENYAAAQPIDGVSEGSKPRLYPGQRVVIMDPNPEAGRMAFVQGINYTDAIQALIAASGTPQASMAEVQSYIVQTRDGRSDVLDVPPDEVKPLEILGGWGRGQI